MWQWRYKIDSWSPGLKEIIECVLAIISIIPLPTTIQFDLHLYWSTIVTLIRIPLTIPIPILYHTPVILPFLSFFHACSSQKLCTRSGSSTSCRRRTLHHHSLHLFPTRPPLFPLMESDAARISNSNMAVNTISMTVKRRLIHFPMIEVYSRCAALVSLLRAYFFWTAPQGVSWQQSMPIPKELNFFRQLWRAAKSGVGSWVRSASRLTLTPVTCLF